MNIWQNMSRNSSESLFLAILSCFLFPFLLGHMRILKTLKVNIVALLISTSVKVLCF